MHAMYTIVGCLCLGLHGCGWLAGLAEGNTTGTLWLEFLVEGFTTGTLWLAGVV